MKRIRCVEVLAWIVAGAAKSDQPFLVENRSGSGVCYFLPGTFGEFYEEARPEMYPRLLSELLGPAAQPVAVTGPPHLMDVHLRLQPGRKRTMVHLVNLELGPIDRIVPAHRVAVEVQVSHPVRSATALRAGTPLKFRSRSGRVSVTLPELQEFDVIAFEG